MPRRKTVRLRAFDYVGEHRYAFTVCVSGRRPAFTDGAAVSDALSHFLHAARVEQVAILTYCFMPDHLHLFLAGLTPTSDVMRFIRSAKQKSGYHHRRRFGRPLWQRYSWDRVLRSDEDTLTVIRYLLDNPVRAGIVNDPWVYPHWGSMAWTREEMRVVLATARAG